MSLHHQLFRCMCPAQGPLEWHNDQLTGTIRVRCLSCRKQALGIEAWNKANTPPLVDPLPESTTVRVGRVLVDCAAGSLITTIGQWVVVVEPNQRPYLVSTISGERFEVKIP